MKMEGGFTVFSKPLCPHCDRVKLAIERKGFDYVEVLHTTADEIEYFRSQGYRSFPMVFFGDKLIGTADQTIAYLQDLVNDDDF